MNSNRYVINIMMITSETLAKIGPEMLPPLSSSGEGWRDLEISNINRDSRKKIGRYKHGSLTESPIG